MLVLPLSTICAKMRAFVAPDRSIGIKDNLPITTIPGKISLNVTFQSSWLFSSHRPMPTLTGAANLSFWTRNCARLCARPKWVYGRSQPVGQSVSPGRGEGLGPGARRSARGQEPRSDFAERMYVYNYRLYDRHHRQIASLAVLAAGTLPGAPLGLVTICGVARLASGFRRSNCSITGHSGRG